MQKNRYNIVRVGKWLFFSTFIFLIVSIPAFARISDDEFEDIVQKEINKNDNIKVINDEIEDKATEVRELSEKLDIYKQQVQDKLNEKLTLENHIAVIEDKINETKTSIDSNKIELEVLQLEIESLQEQIRDSEKEITRQKEKLAEIISDIYLYEQKTALEITFENATITDFFCKFKLYKQGAI